MKRLDQPIMVTKSFLPPFEEYIMEIQHIWNNGWLTNKGRLHAQFEENLVKYLKVKNVSLFTNGHLALEIAIRLLNLKGEVITTPFTFASTTHAIINSGLKPVFCDIDKYSFNLDPTKIENLITENTSAIIPVHVFGYPCNITKINEIAKKYDLKVIYDAAHAFGVEIEGTGIANFGDISMFSLHATKVFHCIEGGILAFNDNKYKNNAELIKNFGISGPENVDICGINAKMNEFQAAMGLVNLRYIEDEIKKRRQVTERYKRNLINVKGINLNDNNNDNVKYNYAYFPILVNRELGIDRDQLHQELENYNIYTRKYFYPLCSDFHCYKSLFNSYETPIAKYIANNILTLPLYGELQLEEVDIICDLIQHCIKKHIERSGL